jgi:serine/threonine protein kinase
VEGVCKNLSRVGQQLGNYRLARLLGSGGFAEVYLGEHVHLDAQAAIKVLLGELTPEDVQTFRSEARTLVRLFHPHIIRVLDFGIEGSTPFLVMDYAPHGTLRQLHPRQSRLPLSTVIPYVQQVAEALQFAHNEQVIHRDIKPENILLGRRKELLLSDFGIALVAQGSLNRNIKNVAGTIAYMAPEQIQGHPHHASDQYALGLVVYEWLCGERPFHGKFMEIATKQLLVSPSPLRMHVPSLPQAVEDVVLTALAKDPKNRFKSVQTFAHALEQAGKETGSEQA